MTYRKQTKNRNKKVIFVVSSLIIVVAISFIWVSVHRSLPATTNTPETNETKTDFSPATEDDKKYSESYKTVDTNIQQTTQSEKRDVTPVIVDASQYGQQIEVRSYISGIIESGGTCIFTFNNPSGSSFQKQSTTIADATTSICQGITIDSSAFSPKGRWSITATYDSSQATGTSSPVNFEVQ